MAIKNGQVRGVIISKLLVWPPQLHHQSTSFSSLFLTFYCQVNVKHSYHLLIFPVAMEVLPVQAPKVPCERVLSRSKETCALRRGCISSIEASQAFIGNSGGSLKPLSHLHRSM